MSPKETFLSKKTCFCCKVATGILSPLQTLGFSWYWLFSFVFPVCNTISICNISEVLRYQLFLHQTQYVHRHTSMHISEVKLLMPLLKTFLEKNLLIAEERNNSKSIYFPSTCWLGDSSMRKVVPHLGVAKRWVMLFKWRPPFTQIFNSPSSVLLVSNISNKMVLKPKQSVIVSVA